MGAVITDPCAPWKGLLALQAAGRSGAHEAQTLDDHLATCAGCRAEAEDLACVARALSALGDEQWQRLAARDDPGADPVPDAQPSVLPTRRQRRTRTRVLVASAVVGAIVVTMALLVVGRGGPAAPTRTVALVGQPGVRATVALSAQGGGTAATLDVAGEPAGRVFTVTMGSGSGGWWVAGSYRTTGAPGSQVVHLSCGLAPDRITGVWVSDQAGRVVLSGEPG